MKQQKNDLFRSVIDSLRVGIAVIGDDDQLLYLNQAAQILWNTASALEGVGPALLAAEFAKSRKAESARDGWIARALGPEPRDTLVVQVVAGEAVMFDGQPARAYALVPIAPDAPVKGPFIYGRFRLDPDHGTLMYGHDYIDLTAVEFRLLSLLLSHGDRLMTKELLLREGWGRRATTTRTLDVTVSRLRRKLQKYGCPPEAIRTVHGRGYRFLPLVLVERDR